MDRAILGWQADCEYPLAFENSEIEDIIKLSLPEDWNYNMQGLASLSRDGIDSVRSAIKELEYYGYVERNMIRNEYGLFTDTEYIIREIPIGQENE